MEEQTPEGFSRRGGVWALFFPFPATVSLFFVSLWVCPQMCTFGVLGLSCEAPGSLLLMSCHWGGCLWSQRCRILEAVWRCLRHRLVPALFFQISAETTHSLLKLHEVALLGKKKLPGQLQLHRSVAYPTSVRRRKLDCKSWARHGVFRNPQKTVVREGKTRKCSSRWEWRHGCCLTHEAV